MINYQQLKTFTGEDKMSILMVSSSPGFSFIFQLIYFHISLFRMVQCSTLHLILLHMVLFQCARYFLVPLNQIFFQFSCLQVGNSLTGQWLDAYSYGICDVKYVPHVLSSPACTPPCHILSLLRVALSYQTCTH